MSKITPRFVVIALAFMGLFGPNVFGKVLVVGNCLGGKSYSTIQSAVNLAGTGDTVEVCPGTYPEQVMIDNTSVTGVTVRGITNNNGQAAIITVPSTGLLVNGMDGGTPVPTQVYVTSVGTVLSNLIVDGSGAACFTVPTIGILFHDVVSADLGTDGGKVQHVAVRNENACQLANQIDVQGAGIVSDGSYITIDANSVNNVDAYGIDALGGLVSVTSNTLSITGPACGICIYGQATAISVNGNVIAGSLTALQIKGDNADLVENNIISSAEVGIRVDTCENEQFLGDKVTNASADALVLVNSQGNNTFQVTVNDAVVGLLGFSTAAPTDVFNNTYFNVTTILE